jgi:hypothetical protein
MVSETLDASLSCSSLGLLFIKARDGGTSWLSIVFARRRVPMTLLSGEELTDSPEDGVSIPRASVRLGLPAAVVFSCSALGCDGFSEGEDFLGGGWRDRTRSKACSCRSSFS